MKQHILEPDPMEALHDGRCPACDSENIEWVNDLATYPVEMMFEGKLCQRVKKSLWQCHHCGWYFASNKFITQ
jgi:predicted Zn-ribbon and HTH transcriptional regulator